MSVIDSNVKTTSTAVYLDAAAELSKIDRKNHKQVTDSGKALVYDLLVSIATPQGANTGNSGIIDVQTFTAPMNWQTRNAVKQAHELRAELRAEAGVVKGSIGRYAKNLRLNIDDDMEDLVYGPPAVGADLPTATSQRLYAMSSLGTTALGGNPKWFRGGVWDYTQLSVFAQEVIGAGTVLAQDFYLHLCGGHEGLGTATNPWTSVGVIKAYNERRQTVRDDSTLTPGGDSQFVDNESPFFRVPEQDVSESSYIDVTLDEQDNPPYDRDVGAQDDSQKLQPCDYFTLPDQVTTHTYRVQAPLGLVKFLINNTTADALVAFGIECLGTYEM